MDLDLCVIDPELYREQYDLACIRGNLSFSSKMFMTNVYNIIEYANFV